MRKSILFALILLFPLRLFAVIMSGVDVLAKEKFKLLKGHRVGLITNQTGVNRRGVSTVDLFHNSKQVDLVKIFSPEHGFRGAVKDGEKIEDGHDLATGLPIISLYGDNKRPTAEMLDGIDMLVYDIQDVGVRFYTFITTMAMAMEEASKRNIKFVILDRPNPIRGDIVEGDVLDSDIKRFTGYFSVPTRYGLTVGELALWYNKEFNINADLKVVPLKDWKRKFWADQHGYNFISPSPNIKTLTSAILYPGVGAFEAVNISVGRGTDSPFEMFGAPWINSKALLAFLREKNLPGVLFELVEFVPSNNIYKNELCHGIKLLITDRNKMRPFQIFLASFIYLYQNHPQSFKPDWPEVQIVTGSKILEEGLRSNVSFETLLSQYDKSGADFQKTISPYYLYK